VSVQCTAITVAMDMAIQAMLYETSCALVSHCEYEKAIESQKKARTIGNQYNQKVAFRVQPTW